MDKPDRIIFEPSGIFIPEVILEQLKGYELSEGCRLNSMVTIIDSVKYLSQREKYGFFFENQIKHASTMLLSKTDNVSRENIDEIKKNLFKINKGADIVSSAWDKLSLADILMVLDGNEKYMPTQEQKIQTILKSWILSLPPYIKAWNTLKKILSPAF